MKIIAHRGDRGVALENSLASIQAGLALDIDAVELDVHLTSDGELVVMHDATTARVATTDVRIADITLAELQKLQLKNGQQISTLQEVLTIAAGKAIYIDIKDQGTAAALVAITRRYPAVEVAFVSRLPAELKAIRELLPGAPTYMYFLKAEYPIPRPIHMVRAAQSVQATGIGVDKLILNPLTYYLALRAGLQMYTYSIGSLWFARLLHRLYPSLDLCTSKPKLLAKHFTNHS